MAVQMDICVCREDYHAAFYALLDIFSVGYSWAPLCDQVFSNVAKSSRNVATMKMLIAPIQNMRKRRIKFRIKYLKLLGNSSYAKGRSRLGTTNI